MKIVILVMSEPNIRSEQQDPHALERLNEYLPKGLFQYFLQLDAMPGFEGYADHTDNAVIFYDMQMHPVHTLPKEKILDVNLNKNDVLGISSTDGTVSVEQ